MTRRWHSFDCDGDMLAATLDGASGSTGLLIVTGGNEVRAGAFGSQAAMAARIAKAGHPVFRFDRRGVGDSEGTNTGFRHCASDIACALETFRALMPQVTRVVAFGNCDAASALMLARGAGFDALVLSNPWTVEQAAGVTTPPPPAALRARYLEKLANPREVMRLLGGGVNLSKLARGIAQAQRPPPPPSSLAQEMAAGLAAFRGDVCIVLAGADRTAQLFEAVWTTGDPRIARCPGAGHAYVAPEHRAWLDRQVLDMLRA